MSEQNCDDLAPGPLASSWEVDPASVMQSATGDPALVQFWNTFLSEQRQQSDGDNVQAVLRSRDYYRSDRFPDESSYYNSEVYRENFHRLAMGVGDDINLRSVGEYPSAWYTAYRRVPTPEEIDFEPRWPWSYLVIVRGSRIGVFPDFLPFCIWIDMPGSIWFNTADMDEAKQFYVQHFNGIEPEPRILPFNAEYIKDSPIDELDPKNCRDLALIVSSHCGPLRYGFEGKNLVRVSPERWGSSEYVEQTGNSDTEVEDSDVSD